MQKVSTEYKKYNPETIIEAKCFELYYALGDNRNRTKLLKQVRKISPKMSLPRLKRMSIVLFWEQRIKARDYNQIVTLKQSAMRNIDDLKIDFFDAIKNTIKRRFVTENKERSFLFNVNDFGDLEKAIKLMLLLAGEATDIHSVKIEVVETIIQKVVQVVSLHVKDPNILSQIALELNEGMKKSVDNQK